MNTKTIVAVLITGFVLMVFGVTAEAAPNTEHVEGNYTYDGPDENLEASADWDYHVTHQYYYDAYQGEANAHAEYTYVNEENHNEFAGGNVHVDGYARVANGNHPYRAGQIKVAEIYTNGNVYTGYENTHHVAYETYYQDGYRYTIEAYDYTERYEQGYEFEGYLKIRNYRVRPASYLTWTPYEQHMFDHSQRVVKSEFRSRNSLETGIVQYIGLPEGTVVEGYTRTSTANGGAGNPMEVVVPTYTVGDEPWSAKGVNNPHKNVVKQIQNE